MVLLQGFILSIQPLLHPTWG